MKKFLVVLCALVLSLVLLTGCEATKSIPDGTYRVEVAECDERGYVDYVEFTFKDGELLEMAANAYSVKDGSLKTDSEEFKESMLAITGTYPEKYYNDLVNQYIEKLDASQIDVVAGATISSNTFIHLMTTAEKAVKSGNIESVVTEQP